MMSALVGYKHYGILIPVNYKTAAVVVSFANTGGSNYQGDAALVITADNTVELIGPQGPLQSAHFEEIQDVTVVDFKGITIERAMSDGSTRLIQPTNAFGIEVIYQPPGHMKRRLKAMTFFRDIAEAWAAAIGNAVENYNAEKFDAGFPGSIRDAPMP